MKSEKKRGLVSLTMFDLVRGVGILFVLVRHSIHSDVSDGLFWKMAYTVLMPVFFMVSGYWLKKRDFKDGVIATFKSCLIPYVIVMALINLVALVHRLLIHNLEEWLHLFFIPSILVMSGDSRIGAMWFVFSLVIGWIIVYGLLLIKDDRIKAVLSVCICFAGTLLLPMKPPFQLAQGMYAQLFLYVGYRIKKKKMLERELSVPIICVLLTIWLVGGYFSTLKYRCDFAFYLWGNGLPAVICSVCGSFLIMYYGIRLNRIENSFTEKIGLLGRYTLWILCVHSFEGAVIPWKYLFQFVSEQSIEGTLSQLVLRSILIYCACVFIKKYQSRRIKNAKKNY